MNKMKNFKRRFSMPRTETIEESLAEFTEQFNQLHNQRNEGEGPTCTSLPRCPPGPCRPIFPASEGRGWAGGGAEQQGRELMADWLIPVPFRPAARSSWQRPPTGAQPLLPHRWRGRAWDTVPWHAVPAKAEPTPLLHGGEDCPPWLGRPQLQRCAFEPYFGDSDPCAAIP